MKERKGNSWDAEKQELKGKRRKSRNGKDPRDVNIR